MVSEAQHKGTQIERVFAALKGGEWRTLPEIHNITGDQIASISSQLRHLRKREHGSHVVKKRRRGPGLWEYKIEAERSDQHKHEH